MPLISYRGTGHVRAAVSSFLLVSKSSIIGTKQFAARIELLVPKLKLNFDVANVRLSTVLKVKSVF
jgi:hypothetical protein